MASKANTVKRQRLSQLFVRSFPSSGTTGCLNRHFFRWSAIGFVPDAHARGTPPNLAHETTHSNLLVVGNSVRSFLGTGVILQDQEQRYGFFRCSHG